jgi:hypothetical protein
MLTEAILATPRRVSAPTPRLTAPRSALILLTGQSLTCQRTPLRALPMNTILVHLLIAAAAVTSLLSACS